ncbi:heterokaryon incompatibility protein-domain-containing protein [Aspergillus coremiiformis]|uniref:Heterokaryon incompatibility protein-domain-containing protein n=1 Tax=Aspergillus coremiiformis TaxID=138285 RepID=A0A5N6ZEJ9_9EURO|nr:heterokaryon incompatibility protein-domain-containing protein [Aspergillus coremiiformis]
MSSNTHASHFHLVPAADTRSEPEGHLNSHQTPQCPYQPIQGKDSIRLLELLPSRVPESPIQIRLHNKCTLGISLYDAISYTWGAPAEKFPIRVERLHFKVTPNLRGVLSALRQEQDSQKLWVDAICINQKDRDEKKQQVGRMNLVYKQATRVVLWLGEPQDDSDLLFTQIVKPGSEKEMRAFENLSEREWFHRVWTIEEACLNPNTVFMCGKLTISFEEIRKNLSTLPPHLVSNTHPGLAHFERLYQLRTTSQRTYLQAITHSRYCQTTKPSDFVYGILGLFNTPSLIPVDYTLDTADVFQAFTKAVMQTEKSFSLLHALGLHRTVPNLPSWVPDYTSPPERSFVLPWLPGDEAQEAQSVSEFQFHGKDLSIHAVPIGKVKSVGDEMPSNTNDDETFMKILGQWKRLLSENDTLDLQSSTRAFGTVLVTDPELGPVFNSWYTKYDAGKLQQDDDSELLGQDQFQMASALSTDCSDLRAEVGIEKYTERFKREAGGRVFFITNDGLMGLAPPGIQSDDEIVYLRGDKSPLILRPRTCTDGAFELLGDCSLFPLEETTDYPSQLFTLR